MLIFSLSLSRSLSLQRLLCRRQQASHQTPTLYPPAQTTAKAGWIKTLTTRLRTFSQSLSPVRRSKELEWRCRGMEGMHTFEFLLIGQVMRPPLRDLTGSASPLTALGFFRAFWVFFFLLLLLLAFSRALRVECELRARICFCSFVRRLCGIVIGAMKGIKSCDWCGRREGGVVGPDSSAAEGCHGCQVPVGLHCKSTH